MLRVAIQMDPIEAVNIESDTTWLMMTTAQDRGHAQWVYDFRTLALEDGKLSTSELRGTPVVLNMWASWCTRGTRSVPLHWRGYWVIVIFECRTVRKPMARRARCGRPAGSVSAVSAQHGRTIEAACQHARQGRRTRRRPHPSRAYRRSRKCKRTYYVSPEGAVLFSPPVS